MAASQISLRQLCLLAFIALGGCDKIPGTDAFKISKARELVAEDLIDPSSATFRNETVHGDAVCGEVNAKNRMAGYVGFSRFVVDGALSLIDPQFEYSDLLSAEDFCRSVSSNSYSSYSTAYSACERASEKRAEQALQQLFDSTWTRHCASKNERGVDASMGVENSVGPALATDSADVPAGLNDTMEPAESAAEGELEQDGATTTAVSETSSNDPLEPGTSIPDQQTLDRVFGHAPIEASNDPAATNELDNDLGPDE